MTQLLIKKLNSNATLPTKAHETDAGYDLYASAPTSFKSSGVVETGISVAIPPGYYGRVASRSGLSFKEDVEVGAGVVDESYRGEIKIKLYCHNPEHTVIIKQGDRVAQLIVTPYASPKISEVLKLPTSDRGEAGFGSTGK
jgi:dUTP pyrophosphatase